MRHAQTYRSARREAAKAEARFRNVPLHDVWRTSDLNLTPEKAVKHRRVRRSWGTPHQGAQEIARRAARAAR